MALVALPIVIHFLFRRRFKRLRWAAMPFLLEAERERRRRRRFEQWLLLAMRCLAMLLLALLLARPYAEPGWIASALGAGGDVERVLVIDDSASLGYRPVADEPELAGLTRAAERLLDWIESSARGDRVSVYLTSRPHEPVVDGQRWGPGSTATIMEVLETASPRPFRAEPRVVLGAIAAGLESSAARSAVVYIFSDFQRSDWLDGDAAVDAPLAALRQLPGAVADTAPAGLRAMLIASGMDRRKNVALTDAHIERPQTLLGIPAVLRGSVVHWGQRVRGETSLQVRVAGVPQPTDARIGLHTEESAEIATEVTFSDPGDHVVELDLGAVDAFAADNVRRLAVEVKVALRVLVVNGDPSSDPRDDEVYLLRNALAPPGQLASGIDLTVIDAAQLELLELEPYELILLCNVSTPTTGAVGALERFVRGGGGLIVFVGDQIRDVERYNRAMYKGGVGLLPAALLPGVVSAPDMGFGMVGETSHPVTAMFSEQGGMLSEYVRFRRFMGTRPVSDDEGAARVLARFTDDAGSPALIEATFGRGRILLFTSTADLDWNNWGQTVDGSYVVTLLEMAQYVARPPVWEGAYVAGQPLTLPLDPETYELNALFKPPGYPEVPAIDVSAVTPSALPGERVSLAGPIATSLGTWRVELQRRAGQREVRSLCVNLAPAESDLRVARRAELEAALGDIPVEYVAAADAFLRQDEASRREIWPTLLYALVAVLLAEQLLAWWFGRMPAR